MEVYPIVTERVPPNQSLIAAIQVNQYALRELLVQITPSIRLYKTVKSLLPALHNRVLAYFEKQNSVPYEALNAKYIDDRISLKTIEFLRYDLRDLEVKFLEFFDKYLSDQGDRFKGSFPKDFTGFAENLRARFDSDQVLLFPLLVESPKNDARISSEKNPVIPIA